MLRLYQTDNHDLQNMMVSYDDNLDQKSRSRSMNRGLAAYWKTIDPH